MKTDNSSPLPEKALHPLKIANYRSYWMVRFASMLALYCMMLIVAWQGYNIARETMGMQGGSLRLGLIGLFQFVPLFILTPLVGWAADRMDRRNIARVTLAVQALVAVLLAWLTFEDMMTLNIIYAIAVILGICRAFISPALSALAPNLVPKESLPTAIALSSIAWQAGMLIGPAVAGPLYVVDETYPYILSAGLFALSVIFMLTIGPVPRSAIEKSSGPIGQIKEGWFYVWRNKLVFGAISLDLFAVLLAGATALIPVYARDILKVGAEGLSILAPAPAIGAAVTALFFSFRPIKTNVGNKMLGAVFVFGVATIIFGLSKLMWLSVAALIVVGAADMFSVYVRQSLIQLHTPDNKRGRVSAISLLTISASNELGEAESGFLAGLVGPVIAVVAGGVGAIVVTAIWARMFPQIGAARTFDPPAKAEKAEGAST